jgi:hypothetical protein
MTYRQLLEYLRSSSARCRLHAENASDDEAARALREMADEMDKTIEVLEAAEHERPAAEIGAL